MKPYLQRDTELLERQRRISRVVIRVGQILLQYGAESALIHGLTKRLGVTLGANNIEIALLANSIVVTTIINEQCITTTRYCPEQGVNMQMVTDVQRICILTEHKIYNLDDVENRLNALKPKPYNRWLVAVMVALSCASFGRLSGGDMPVFIMIFIASFIGMIVRQKISSYHFNPLLTFAMTAFVTTFVAAVGIKLHLVTQPLITMGSSVLMLVPGFPLINSVADMVKGYMNMGLARWTMATLLTLATTLGIVAAMYILNVWGWN